MHQSTQPPYSRSLDHGRGAARMTGGDVHGFYRALGIELPQWSSQNVSIPCFADPEAHAHGDRNPSCSVSLVTGAWRCWSCGAKGGAYDAAHDHFDRSPRDAMDLLIQYGLAERRHSGPTPRRPRPPTHRGSASRRRRAARASPPATPMSPPGGARSPITPGRRRSCARRSAACGTSAPRASSSWAWTAGASPSRSDEPTASFRACCATRPPTPGGRR